MVRIVKSMISFLFTNFKMLGMWSLNFEPNLFGANFNKKPNPVSLKKKKYVIRMKRVTKMKKSVKSIIPVNIDIPRKAMLIANSTANTLSTMKNADISLNSIPSFLKK